MSSLLRSRWLAGAAICAGLVHASGAVSAQSRYQAVDLGFAGNYGTVADGIGSGQAAGYDIVAITYVRHVAHYQLHAIAWVGSGLNPVDLTPANAPYARANGASSGRQAGWASIPVNGLYYSHAMVWAGTAASAVDLNSAGFDNSYANGIRGTQVVGQAGGAATGGHNHAVVWDLTSGAAVDLNGTGHQESGAVATSISQQVGWANDPSGASTHAMLWQGTAASAIDLHPSRFLTSSAYGVDAGTQVGVGQVLSLTHALLWRGSAASVVDLNPPGFVYTLASAVGGARQAGFGARSDYKYHALVWSGTASSFVDLQQFLPASFAQSYATGIDSSGNVAGYATDTAGVNHAMLWRPTN